MSVFEGYGSTGRRHWVVGTLSVVLGSVGLLACKPDHEPSRRGTGAALAFAAVEGDVSAPRLPDISLHHEGPPDVGTQRQAEALATARVQADLKAAEGIALLEHLDLRGAAAAFQAALGYVPGHPAANYHLARLYALEGRGEDALQGLARIARSESPESVSLLKQARLNDDFESIRANADFAAYTGYVSVTVANARNSKRAGVVVDQLVAAHIPASLGEAHADKSLKTRVFFRPGSLSVETMVAEVLVALRDDDATSQQFEDLDGPHPILVVTGARAPRMDPASRARFEAFIGPELHARSPVGLETLQLKASSFFSWQTRESDGRTISRTGRYYYRRGKLALSFHQTTETPATATEESQVHTERGRRSVHSIEVLERAVKIDELIFAPNP